MFIGRVLGKHVCNEINPVAIVMVSKMKQPDEFKQQLLPIL